MDPPIVALQKRIDCLNREVQTDDAKQAPLHPWTTQTFVEMLTNEREAYECLEAALTWAKGSDKQQLHRLAEQIMELRELLHHSSAAQSRLKLLCANLQRGIPEVGTLKCNILNITQLAVGASDLSAAIMLINDTIAAHRMSLEN